MQDDLDQMLQGEEQTIPAESQQQDGSGSNSDNQNDGSGGQAEEVEFSKLTGSAQDRFRRLYHDKQQAQQELQKMRQLMQNGAQQTNDGKGLAPDVAEAVKKLDDVGIATKEFVQKQIQDILAQKTYYDELEKLESQLNGNDGRPKFTREEYYDYVDKHPQFKNYLPQDVYTKMYEDELFDWKAKNGNQSSTNRTQQLRPTRSQIREEGLTVDEIEAKLKSLPEPQRSEWYTANKKKIDEAVARMSQA